MNAQPSFPPRPDHEATQDSEPGSPRSWGSPPVAVSRLDSRASEAGGLQSPSATSVTQEQRIKDFNDHVRSCPVCDGLELCPTGADADLQVSGFYAATFAVEPPPARRPERQFAYAVAEQGFPMDQGTFYFTVDSAGLVIDYKPLEGEVRQFIGDAVEVIS